MDRVTFKLMLVIMVSKVIGFLRQITLTYFYGTSVISDAYLTAVQVPVQIIEIFTYCVVFVFLPEYNRVKENLGERSGNYYTNQILRLLMLFSGVAFALVQINPQSVIKIFAPGYGAEQITMCTDFIRITIFCIFFISATQLFSSYLNANNSFIQPAFVTIISNIITIVSFFFSKSLKIGIYVLPIGFVLAKIIEMLFLIPNMKKNNFKLQLFIPTEEKHDVGKSMLLLFPLFVGNSVSQLNLIIDRGISSLLGEGSVSVITNAMLIKNLFEGIFVTAIVTTTFQTLSTHYAKNNLDKFKEEFAKAFTLINFMMIPIAVGTFIFAYPATKIIFERGAFVNENTIQVSNVLREYGISLIFAGLNVLCARFFYSVQDTKIPMRISLLTLGLHFVSSFTFAKLWGLPGIARASICSLFFSVLAYCLAINRKIGGLSFKNMFLEGFKYISSSLLSGTAAYMLYANVQFGNVLIAFSFSITIFLLLYLLIAYFFKSKVVYSYLMIRKDNEHKRGPK